jgi:hypothetical protein
MLTVAIQSEHVGKVLGPRKFDAQSQGGCLAAIPGRSQANGSGGPGDLPRSIAGTIVNHDDFFNMLLSAPHHLGDVRDFVEGRNERASSHAAGSSVGGDAREKNAGFFECITRAAAAKTWSSQDDG